MGFWNTSDNQGLPSNGQFETGGGDIEPIPSNTSVLAAPDEAKWDEYQGDRYINLRWVVLAPAEYKNRKIFQKIRVNDSDLKKRDKAIRMLAAIDSNAGGKLMATGREPSDGELISALANRQMVLKLQVWETDDKKRGNWVAAVSPKKGTDPVAPVIPESPAAAMEDDDESIPF
jgi:hypothetical protein